MRVYLLVGYSSSPIYLTSPKIKTIYADKKEANAEADRLNNSFRTSKTYWVESMKVKEKNT
jgi:hypothetical protein